MDEYLGTILQFGFDYPVKGWMKCHGQILLVNNNRALFALIGFIYGGDGGSTFALPDLRKRDKNGVYYRVGQIMEDGTPYLDSYICVNGMYPQRD